MPKSVADISVVICTHNRAESLRETLACLARADKTGLRCEVVVVDNGSTDHTAIVAHETIPDLPIHYLIEPLVGKGHALNRALDDAPLGKIVAVLDDDMIPQPRWLLGVAAICQRWPDRDLFTGHSYVEWPQDEIPEWARFPQIHGWAFSVKNSSVGDRELGKGRWFSGNNFWFRSRVLTGGRRFPACWLTEPEFQLELLEAGYNGISAPDAVVGRRIQPELLRLDIIQERGLRFGRETAEARLRPYRDSVHQAQQFKQHPLLARGFLCVAPAKVDSGSLRVTIQSCPGLANILQTSSRHGNCLLSGAFKNCITYA